MLENKRQSQQVCNWKSDLSEYYISLKHPQKQHYKNTTTKTPLKEQHYKNNTTRTTLQEQYYKNNTTRTILPVTQ